jgi:hypothetical protein
MGSPIGVRVPGKAACCTISSQKKVRSTELPEIFFIYIIYVSIFIGNSDLGARKKKDQ